MTATTIPFVKPQYFDNNGDPAAGYKLYTYAAGTTTKQPTYSDADLSAANANPIVLDAAGRATIYLSPLVYKFVLATPTDTDPPLSPLWTVDNVTAVAPFNPTLDVVATAGELISFAEVVHLADGAGGLTAGRWYRGLSTNYYQSSAAPLLGFPTTNIQSGAVGTVRIMGRVTGLGALTAGARYYVSNAAGQITVTKLDTARLVGYADSTSSLILTPAPLQWRQLVVEFGRPGAGALTTGVNKFVPIYFPALVTGWTLVAEQSGSVVIDVWRDTYANFPPTVADTIAGSELPTLTAQQKNQDNNLSTWTNLIRAGDVLGFNVNSVATINYACLTLELLMV